MQFNVSQIHTNFQKAMNPTQSSFFFLYQLMVDRRDPKMGQTHFIAELHDLSLI